MATTLKSPFYSWSIFEVANCSSVHADNENNDILILRKNPTQSLDDTLLTAEAQYYINFSEQLNKFCLSLHYNGSNICLFVNAVRAKESDLNLYLIFLCNISKVFTVNNMKNNRLYEYVHDFSVDYRSIDVEDILDICK